jgi:hypothetical protein
MSYLDLAKRAEERFKSAGVVKDVAPGSTCSLPYTCQAPDSTSELSERSEKTPSPPVAWPRDTLGETAARLLAMPLDVFARDGQPLEVRVPWAPVTLWFCPDVHHAEALINDGVSRGRIWTAAELMDLLSPGDLTPEAIRVVALAKLEFDGDVVSVRRRAAFTVRPSQQGNGGSR